MKIVETKTYNFEITSVEREHFENTAEFLRNIEREIDNIIGEDYPIEIGGGVFSGMDLWRAAELLDGIALDNYEI
jgi:hypothetical protein